MILCILISADLVLLYYCQYFLTLWEFSSVNNNDKLFSLANLYFSTVYFWLLYYILLRNSGGSLTQYFYKL